MSIVNHQTINRDHMLSLKTSIPTQIPQLPISVLSQTRRLLDFKSQFAQDYYCGGCAGFITGIVFTPVEYLKVQCQFMKEQINKLRTLLREIKTYKNMIKFTGPYAILVAGACSLQFSVNRRIGTQFNQYAGILASALTGAFFLTPADHMMLRKIMHDQKLYKQTKKRSRITNFQILRQLYKIKPNAIFTGFVPMIGREAIFISSVMHLGPALGKVLNGNSKYEDIGYNTVGRIITGVVTTIISQPFDNISRSMQEQFFNDKMKFPSLYDGVAKIKKDAGQIESLKPLFRGAVARMGMATLGGTFVGGLFDYFKSSMHLKQKSAIY